MKVRTVNHTSRLFANHWTLTQNLTYVLIKISNFHNQRTPKELIFHIFEFFFRQLARIQPIFLWKNTLLESPQNYCLLGEYFGISRYQGNLIDVISLRASPPHSNQDLLMIMIGLGGELEYIFYFLRTFSCLQVRTGEH